MKRRERARERERGREGKGDGGHSESPHRPATPGDRRSARRHHSYYPLGLSPPLFSGTENFGEKFGHGRLIPTFLVRLLHRSTPTPTAGADDLWGARHRSQVTLRYRNQVRSEKCATDTADDAMRCATERLPLGHLPAPVYTPLHYCTAAARRTRCVGGVANHHHRPPAAAAAAVEPQRSRDPAASGLRRTASHSNIPYSRFLRT